MVQNAGSGEEADPDEAPGESVPRGGPGARPRVRRTLIVLGALMLVAGAVVSYAHLIRTSPPEPPVAALIDPDSGEVSAFPGPGTAVVHPEAQLSFRGLAAEDLGEVVVTGSDSGRHTTAVIEHSDGEGVSLQPDEPFTEEEQVTITTDHQVRGSEDGEFTLTVAELGVRPDLSPPEVEEISSAEADPDSELAVEYLRQYPSAPGIEPPQVQVTGSQSGATDAPSPALTAIGVKNGYGQKGPMLVDDAGEPVWFLPLADVDARDVQVQTYQGEPVLTWWEGVMGPGFGYGEAVFMDTSYQEVARVNMAGGYDADSHEVRLTEDGTVLLIAYEPVQMDLSHLGGPASGTVVDSVIQEIDLATGAMLYEWHSVGQVALAESYLPAAESEDMYDYFHANSVEVDDDGDLLISARHTCAVYSLDRQTASVEWRLGGRESDYTMGTDSFFIKQHDARRSADGTLTLLDNGGECGETSREVTRGIALELDETAMTAELVREYIHPEEVFSQSQANFQELADGEVLVGWGSVPRYTLMAEDGEVLVDGAIPEELSVTSYRAHRVAWTGNPSTDPAAVLQQGDEGQAVHISWNGATEVVTWRVVDSSGEQVASADQEGFETVLPVDLPAGGSAGELQVQALDGHGQVLGVGAVTDG